MNDTLRCPKCKCTVPTRDNVHYGVHFETTLATRPCVMSCKPIVLIETPVVRDLHHSQGVLISDILSAADRDLKEKGK